MPLGLQMVLALVIGIAALIFMIVKTKIHTFIALLVACVVIGVIGGMSPASIVGAIQGGFGTTLGNIGIIIGFGVMMGVIFETSGSAERMARTFLKLFGKNREEPALALTGFIVSIPVFCDSGFIILHPIAKTLSRKIKKSIVGLSVPLAAGLVITHSMVPPTPGPLGVAAVFGVDVGQYLLWGLLICIPMAIATTIYGKWLGRRIYQLPAEDGEGWVRPGYSEPRYDLIAEESERKLPSTFNAFLPLVAPIILILINTVLNATLGAEAKQATLVQVLTFLGTPIIAVGIGLLLSVYVLAFRSERKVVLADMEKGMRASGMILLVTGGGGALGRVLTESGTGMYIAQQIAATPIPVILLPFLIATLVRFVQGSGTVAMITSASITAPIVAAAGGNMLLAAFAASTGSLFFSYFNDSYFWVINRLCGIDNAKEQIRVWSVTTTIAWAVGLVILLVVSIFVR